MQKNKNKDNPMKITNIIEKLNSGEELKIAALGIL